MRKGILGFVLFGKVFDVEGAGGVEDGDDHDADVGEDGRPHAGDAQRAEDEADALDAQRKDDVLIHDAVGAARDPHGQSDLGRVVVHHVYADKTLDAHDSTTPEQIVAKFEAAVNEMDASKRQHIIQFVIDLGKQKSIAPLMDLLA